MAGPAADNPNLRGQLKAAINEASETWEQQGHPESAPGVFLIDVAILPLVVAFGDARYQEGRRDGISTSERWR